MSENKLAEALTQFKQATQEEVRLNNEYAKAKSEDLEFLQAKKEYERYNDPGAREDIRLNNTTVGEISISKGSEGRYIVKDPKAYAAVLKQIQWTLDDGRDAWYTTIMPCEEACKPDFLDELIRAHDGEIPKGVEYKNGTSSTVKVVLNHDYATSALDIKEILKTNILQIEEGKK